MVSYGHFIVLSIGKWNVTDLVSVPVYNILPHETASQVGQHDSGGFSADWAKAEDSLVVVVRPDMYIGYVGGGNRSQGWKAYLVTYNAKST